MKRLAYLGLAAIAACHRASVNPTPSPAGSAYDVVIENGRVVDGTGAAWFYGDVGIRGDRIAAVTPRGMLRSAAAKSRVDARDLVVAPGFIDIQDQSGGQLLAGDGRQLGKLTQGVTTGILGEGSTPAPLNPASLRSDANEMTRSFATPHGFDAWLSAMEAHGISQNVGSFVGAGTIRAVRNGRANGSGDRRDARLDARRGAARDGGRRVRHGERADLSARHLRDDRRADRESKAMAPYGGVYITHMRSEADHLLEAIDEAIRIAHEGGVPGEIYHLKAAGTRNWPKERAVIAKIDSARAAGIDVQANMYPYPAGGDRSHVVPAAVSTRPRESCIDNLASQDVRAKIRAGGGASDERVGEPVRARDAEGRAHHQPRATREPAVHRQAARRDRADEERATISTRRWISFSRSTVASRRRTS